MDNYLVKTSSLTRYLSEINRFPILSREEEYRLAVRYRENNDIEAAHRLVTSNLRFVVKIALQFKSYGVKITDLIQEGNMGLMVAVKRFDPSKGFRLISYAVWWIKAYIQKFILETYSIVKMGTTQIQRKLFTSLSKIRKALTRIDGLEPSDKVLAEALDVKTKEVSEMRLRMANKDYSLDNPVNEEKETTHLEMLPSPNASQEEIVAKAEETDTVRKAIVPFIANLKEKERFILENRIIADEPVTLQEIGDRYNISRERARQIEDRVKSKIKGYLTDKGLAPA